MCYAAMLAHGTDAGEVEAGDPVGLAGIISPLMCRAALNPLLTSQVKVARCDNCCRTMCNIAPYHHTRVYR